MLAEHDDIVICVTTERDHSPWTYRGNACLYLKRLLDFEPQSLWGLSSHGPRIAQRDDSKEAVKRKVANEEKMCLPKGKKKQVRPFQEALWVVSHLRGSTSKRPPNRFPQLPHGWEKSRSSFTIYTVKARLRPLQNRSTLRVAASDTTN